jgi:hypothetical protein
MSRMPSHSPIAHDSTAATQLHRPDDRFIPIRAAHLTDALVEDAALFGIDASPLRTIAGAIRDVFEHEAARLERELCDAYAAVNPDRDTILPPDALLQRTPEGYSDLLDRLHGVLTQANYRPVPEVQIDAAIRAANTHGLRVRLHPERVEHFEVWVRGRGTVERWRRTWRHPVDGEPRRYDMCSRLVLIARLRDDPHVILKMFKDIPTVDIDALLPHAEVQMSWIDRLMLFGSGGGVAVSSAGKIVGLITGVLVLSKILWALLAGAVIIGVRTVLGYRRARHNRESQRTRHLYYQNLGNNEGVIHSLLSMIAQEECKEALLCYAFCQTGAPPVDSPDALAARIEEHLRQRYGVSLDFDAQDAIDKLGRLKLWNDRDRLTAVPPDEALRLLAGATPTDASPRPPTPAR